MIIGLGIDVVELDRVARALERHGERFARRILTDREMERFQAAGDKTAHLAARFAAKEAAVKALGVGFSLGVGFHSVEVDADQRGGPILRLRGKAVERSRMLAVTHSHVSITHGRDVAAAVVVMERL